MTISLEPMLYENKPFVLSDVTTHSMGKSLHTYLEIKIHHLIEEYKWEKIIVVGEYDRNIEVSGREKTGKLANWQLPTATRNETTLLIKCFPGRDYVRHYAAVIASHLSLNGGDPNCVSYILPSEIKCFKGINNSNLDELPVNNTAVIGWGMPEISGIDSWEGKGPFLYGSKKINGKSVTFIICKHSFWGDIGGHIVTKLSDMGFMRVIFLGKLGGMNNDHFPNQHLATGGLSFVEGEMISWENPFKKIQHPLVHKGVHCSVPSVLYETKAWLKVMNQFDFVDPEIGHLARAAKNAGISFGYLHLISDNVTRQFSEDLSNERLPKVIQKRKAMIQLMKALLEETL